MSETKRGWTPGEWRAKGVHVFAPGTDSPLRMVADCDSLLKSRAAEDKANARLIAAAPDLFDALVEMAATHETYCPYCPDCEVAARARAALAKASGGEK